MTSHRMYWSPSQDSGYSGSPTELSPSQFVHAPFIETAGTFSIHVATALSNPYEADRLEFWNHQQFTADVARRFLEVTKHILLYGPDHSITGVRMDDNLASKADIPVALLYIIEDDPTGSPTSRVLALGPKTCSRNPPWDAWDVVGPALKRDWPMGMSEVKPDWTLTTDLDASRINDKTPKDAKRSAAQDWAENVMPYRKSIHLHPGHFNGDWTFFKGARITLVEYSFTDTNFPLIEIEETLLPGVGTRKTYPKLHDHFSKPRLERLHSDLGRADLYGRSWTIHPKGSVMSLNTWSFASSQVILGHDIEDDSIFQLGIMLPKRYASPWPSTIWTNWCLLGTAKLHLQFHVRSLSVAGTVPDPGQAPESTRLQLKRDRFQLAAGPGIDGELSITESRVSIGMLTTLWTKTPNFTMVTLADAPSFSVGCLDDQFRWTTMGLQPSDDEFGGVVIFQVAVGCLVTEWEKCWTPTLEQISYRRNATIRGDIGSARYGLADVKARHLCYKARDMIVEFGKDLQSLQRDVNISLAVSAKLSKGIVKNWEALNTSHRRAERILLDMVEENLARLEVCHCPRFPWQENIAVQ